MPRLDRSISHVTKYIIRPTSEQVTQKVLTYLGIQGNFSGNVYFNDDTQAADILKDEHGNIKTSFIDKLTVTITPTFSIKETKYNMEISKFVHNGNNNRIRMSTPVFEDSKNGIYLYEYQTPVSIQLDFAMRFRSIDAAEEAAFKLNNKVGESELISLTEFTYWYPIPLLFIKGLYELYQLIPNKASYPAFKDYVSTIAGDNIGAAINRDNQNIKQLVSFKTHSSVLCQFGYDFAKPEPEMTNHVANAYNVSFSCIYQFACPSYTRLQYPVSLGQSPIPDFLLNQTTSDMMSYNARFMISDEELGAYQLQMHDNWIKQTYMPPTIIFPAVDDWMITDPYTDRRLIQDQHLLFQCVCTPILDDTTGKLKLSLNLTKTYYEILASKSLTDVSAAIDAIMKADTNAAGLADGDSIFMINFFIKGVLIQRDQIQTSINSDGDVIISTTDDYTVDQAASYRFTLGMTKNLRSVNEAHIRELVNHIPVFSGLVYPNLKKLEEMNVIKIIDKKIVQNQYGKFATLSVFRILNTLCRVLRYKGAN